MKDNKVINVLMVEDDEVDIMNAQRLFRKTNRNALLHIAHNGQEALDLLRREVLKAIADNQRIDLANSTQRIPNTLQQNPWAILLDMNLPRMNGMEFFRALSQIPDLTIIPIVILISFPKDRERPEYDEIKALNYMMKPITSDDLSAILAEVKQYWEGYGISL